MLALVHDFPFRSQAGELSLALELAGELATATADHPDVLPVFVSLTSGDASPELQEALDAAGGIPIVRGTVPAFAAIARLAWWEAPPCAASGRRAGASGPGPRWPPTGHRTATTAPSQPSSPPSRA